eukprot:6395847-Ditylum_brightwellii.AAC.1
MKVVKEFSREATQLVATKTLPIAFEIETTMDQKIEKSRTYKQCTQQAEENLSVYSLSVDVFELDSPDSVHANLSRYRPFFSSRAT